MGSTSSYSWGARAGVVAVGAVLALAGWVAQQFVAESSSLGYRVLQAPDGGFGAYRSTESGAGHFEMEADSDDSARVLLVEESHRTVVFEGSMEDAAFWLETGGATAAFTGEPGEVERWIDEQNAAEDRSIVPVALMSVGLIVMLAGLATGWRRQPAV